MTCDAYRDGLSALRTPYEEARDRALARGRQLSKRQRYRLPVRLRLEVEQLEVELGGQPASLEAVRAAERRLEQYEQSLAAAVEWGQQRTALGLRRAARWRRAKWACAVGMGLLLPCVAWWGLAVSERHQALLQRCANSDACATEGRCHAPLSAALFAREAAFEDSLCTDPGCSAACARFGRCELVYGRCLAVDEENCRQSTECREHGECSLYRGQCWIRTHADCRQSRGCRREGLCSVGETACVAETTSDCLDSEACREENRCQPRDSKCVQGWPEPDPCEQECHQEGRCQQQGDDCVARSDLDCAFSVDCEHRGLCAAQDGRCVATYNVHCRQAIVCTQLGRCFERDGECVRR